MAAAVTATPDPTTATVTVGVTGFTVAWTLTRADPDGAVRLVAGATGITGDLTVRDHRCPFGVPVTYSATDGTTTVTATATLTVGVPWLHRPDSFTADMACLIVMDSPELPADRSTVHWVIGRPDPIVVGEVVGNRKGTLDLWAETRDEATALAGMWSAGIPVLLRVPAGATVRDGWLAAVGGITEDLYLPGGPRQVHVPYQRVGEPDARPPIPQVWTWDDVPAYYAIWTAFQASFDSWDEAANHPVGSP